MAKIMLVEDDNNLREIYEARLLAEGYTIVSAEDGEQALAMAVKEKPDLIISDVMMPKISGFDMLDILRSTPETQHTKVIMMTALSQAEDKMRADKLGADRYLVKSQVTLEDVARVAGEILQDSDTLPADIPGTANATSSEPTGSSTASNTTSTDDATQPAIATTQDSATDSQQATTQNASAAQTAPAPDNPQPATTGTADVTNVAADTAADMANAVNDLLQKPTTNQEPTTPDTPQPLSSNQIAGKKVIAPLNDLSNSGPDLNALLAKEMGQDINIPAPSIETPLPLAAEAPAPTPADTQAPLLVAEEAPVDVPFPGNVQTPGTPDNPVV